MNIGVLGVGGVGGYFGAKICRSKEALGANVYFVARGAHLKAIQDHGLIVRTSSEGTLECRPTRATDSIEELPVLDACLVCVKSFDLDELVVRLASKVSGETEVVPLLNGIDVRERIREHLPDARVFPACVFIGTHIAEPGVVSQDGGACRILYGRASPEAPVPSLIPTVFGASSIRSEGRDDVYPAIWAKFVFIASFGLVTACFDKTMGQVMESDELGRRVRSIMVEVSTLAALEGIRLPASIVEDSFRKGAEFPPDTKTSFQRDFASPGRPDERDLLGGTIVRLGRKLHTPTPQTDEVFGMICRKKPASCGPIG